MTFKILPVRARMLLVCALWIVFSTVTYGQEYLIGFTQYGGSYNKGVPYQINTDGSGFMSFKDFDGNTGEKPGDGAGFTQFYYPIVNAEGQHFAFAGFSGMTQSGDQNLGLGARVNVTPGEGGFAPPPGFHFGGYLGTNPGGRFLMGFDMQLIGLTSAQGSNGNGAVFTTSAIVGSAGGDALFSFDGINGKSPKGSLILGPDGKAFGMTELGGTHDLGVIFSVGVVGTGNTFGKLLDFDGATNGSNPTGNLVLAADGRMYGMTRTGGTSGKGVIFSLSRYGTDYKKLMDFNGAATGGNPKGSLTEFTDGKLYGMTSSGGAYGYGTIFSITPSGVFTKILDFDGTNGKSPVGDLLVSTSGTVMYGVAYAGGANDDGVLFKLENGNQFTKLYDFSKATGSNPVGSLLMKKQIPAITFPPIARKNTLSAPFAPGATSTTVLPIYYVSDNHSVAVIENNQIKIVGQGVATITAFQLDNHAYLAQAATQDVVVDRALQTITFDPIPAKTFGDPSFTIKATSSSGLPVTFNMYSNNVATLTGDVVSILGGGTVTIVAHQTGDAKYAAAPDVTQTLVIDRATQTIAFNPTPTVICCQPFSLSATASSKLAVSFKTLDWKILQIGEYQVQPVGVGPAEVIAYQPGNANYKPAETRATIEVLKGNQFLTFSIFNGPFKFGDPPGYVSSSSSSGLPVTYTSDPPGIAVVEGANLYILGVGTTKITASQPGNDLYYPASSVSTTITIAPPKTPPTDNVITWPNVLLKTMVDPPFNLTASASSGLPISYTSSDPTVATVSGNLVTIKGVGSTTITATQAGTSEIPAATAVKKVLQVDKQYQYVYFSLNSYATFGNDPISLPPTSSAGLPITYTSSNNSVAIIEDYFLHFTGAGQVTIIASQAGDSRYMPAQSASQTINVNPLYQSITFDNLPAKTYGDAPFNLVATASSGMPVTFFSSDPKIASVTGSTVTILGAGTVTIKASQSGVPGYYAAEVSKPLVINKKSQTITFPALSATKYGAAPFLISATSSANLPVTFTSAKPAVAKVSGNVVTITGNGTADIVASQPGNENYLPAPVVHQQFLVADAGNTYDIVGATSNGGANGTGTVYAMNSEGADFNIIKSFSAQNGGLPEAGLTKGTDGRLYGNLYAGGKYGNGQIIRLEADGTGYTVLHDLIDAEGSSPFGNLIQASNGDLYGLTSKGGTFDWGTIFKLKTDGTGFTVLHSFSYTAEGSSPLGGLLQASDGKLYGMTRYGFYGSGTIFSIQADGSAYTTIFSLTEAAPTKSGTYPRGDLIQGADGFLYGTLLQGGANNKGTLFKIKTDGSGFAKLVDFDGAAHGASPASTLLWASDSKIYGMAQAGGANGVGAIFSLNADGSNFTRLFDFDNATTGGSPPGELTEGSDGLLYGMTNSGGANSFGTAFSIQKNGSNFHKLIDFDSRAATPTFGPLVESGTGVFFGMTTNGGVGNTGAIFSITSSGTFAVVKNFPGEESRPWDLVSDATGQSYYGVATSGASNGRGSFFRIDASGSSYQKLADLAGNFTAKKIIYVSDGYLWCLGFSDTGAYGFYRSKIDGSGLQKITLVDGATQKGISPQTMMQASNGYLYGMGYSNGLPVVFRAKSDVTEVTKLFDLPSGVEINASNILEASDGNFYAATTYNSFIFKFTATGGYTKVFTFPTAEVGEVPIKIIELNGGSLGIITSNHGTGNAGAIFMVEKDGTGYSKIYDPKNNDGISPIDMFQTMDGWIYVAAQYGGSYDNGTIYKIRGDGSSLTKVHDFKDTDGDSPSALIFKKAPQTFTFDALSEKKTSDPAFFPDALSSSGAPIQFSSSNPAVAIIERGRIKPVGIGTTVITAKLPGSTNFFKADDIERQLVVVRGDQTISFDALTPLYKSDAPFELKAVASSGLPVTYQSSNTTVATIDGNVVTIKGLGSTIITASQPGDVNFYPAANVQQTFTVKKGGAQTIQFAYPGSRALDNGPFQLTATASSGLPVSFTTSSGNISLSGSTVTPLNPGLVTIQANQPGDTDFQPAPLVEVSFCINPPQPKITISGLGPEFVLQSSSPNGNQWYYNDTPLPGINTNTISVTDEGTYTVVVTVAGCSSTSAPKAFVTTSTEQQPQVLVNISPNPSRDAFNVEIEGAFKQAATLELIDGTGRSIAYRQQNTPGTVVFDVHDAPVGLYLMKITANGKILFRKLLKE
ncbi:Por secretion system C-terminal sorting domain-containing protein [Chryseolinea serpens]|uniref:Por secretion system C-terminal sorting domain-containing protein n=1 Tax=Chryseolinea serpens TaxID=947013 RepID=A0A1M5RJF7_9BACT|nr:choice-of-anchor tandem repeat GloVer-containing protein [Chryseolinea serpens]SHH25933.1 Por secretion system C-terminal sorting domain-containing protein [Chryseolinea serpens]